jgi:pyruvate,water dikinase
MMSGLGGDEQLKSMGPLLGISAMKEGKMTREEFIRNYGHRGPNEAEFSTPRTGENPDWIDILMDQWRDSDVDRLLQKQKENRERIWKEIDQKLPKQANKLRTLFAASATHAQNREYVRSESIRQMWVIRKFVEKASQLNGLRDELYYLSKSEVLRYLQGDTGLLENVKNRRETYNICKDLPALPNIISGQIDPLVWAKDPKLGEKQILAFGNTLGDYQMFEYTSTNERRHLVMWLEHDDGERECQQPLSPSGLRGLKSSDFKPS